MARLLIYDAYENKVYTYNSLNENDPMPYTHRAHPDTAGVPGQIGQSYPVDHHCRHGGVEPDPPQVRQEHPGGYAFRRIWEGGHGTRSQHYAGVAFDVASA